MPSPHVASLSHSVLVVVVALLVAFSKTTSAVPLPLPALVPTARVLEARQVDLGDGQFGPILNHPHPVTGPRKTGGLQSPSPSTSTQASARTTNGPIKVGPSPTSSSTTTTSPVVIKNPKLGGATRIPNPKNKGN
ncbi:hypothetical protein JCM10212_002883 [Sporobolomyces blumeae]